MQDNPISYAAVMAKLQAMEAVADERHENTLLWRKGHDARHEGIERKLSSLESSRDAGRGAIDAAKNSSKALVILTALVGFIAWLWNWLHPPQP